jgi:hypothetical protein
MVIAESVPFFEDPECLEGAVVAECAIMGGMRKRSRKKQVMRELLHCLVFHV